MPGTRYPQASRIFYDDSDDLPSKDVRSLAMRRGGEIWAGTGSGIARFRKGKWESKTDPGWPDGNVDGLHCFNGGIVASSDGEAMIYSRGRWSRPGGPVNIAGAAQDQEGTLWAVAENGLWSLDGRKWNLRKRNDDGIRFTDFIWQERGRGVASTRDGLFFLQGKRLYWYLLESHEDKLVSNDVRSLREDGRGNIWCATDSGISIYTPPNGWCNLAGRDGVPIEELTAIENGVPGTLWFGSDLGLMRLMDGEWKYMASRRYLPDDRVNSILPVPDGDVWIGTPCGVSHITFRGMTLAEKAGHYAKLTEKHHKRHGFCTIRWMSEPGNLDSGFVEVSDNDGTWTGLYLASLCFRYAVKREPSIKRLISESLGAMLFLEEITPVPGLPARSVRFRDDPSFGDGHPEFHLTPDGKNEWKSDTSSDEIDAHYFSLSICHDLAANEKEKAKIGKMVGRMTDHIIDNDYYLLDADGKPTTWGVWSPERLNDDDRWRMQKGLNSLEIISHLKTAHHITGKKRYLQEYERLTGDKHYALNSVKQRITIMGHHTWHDDQLAMLSYYPLLLYEDDPDLRQILLLGLERTWRELREMRYPFWNFIYGAVTGKPCDVGASVDHFARLPLDLVKWSIKNGVRADFRRNPEDPGLALVPFPADERTIENSDGCFFRIDGGNNGMVAQDGTIYLLPYWMGRYHGLIE